MMASEEVKGSFYRYDFWVITGQLATGAGALERELLALSRCKLFKHCKPLIFLVPNN